MPLPSQMLNEITHSSVKLNFGIKVMNRRNVCGEVNKTGQESEYHFNPPKKETSYGVLNYILLERLPQ